MSPVLSKICSPVDLSPIIIAFVFNWLMVRPTVAAAVSSFCRKTWALYTTSWIRQKIKNSPHLPKLSGRRSSHVSCWPWLHHVLTTVTRCWRVYHSLHSNHYRRCRTAQHASSSIRVTTTTSPHHCLIQLHWLPVPAHVQYKPCTLMHSVHNNRCPTYISDVVQSTKTASTRGGLRLAESTNYVLPWLRTKFAERGFSYTGPAAWNRLPESIRRTSSQAAFKRQLKTFLYSEAFNICCDSS